MRVTTLMVEDVTREGCAGKCVWGCARGTVQAGQCMGALQIRGIQEVPYK